MLIYASRNKASQSSTEKVSSPLSPQFSVSLSRHCLTYSRCVIAATISEARHDFPPDFNQICIRANVPRTVR